MDDNELYPIGDVARRTGLSVSAIRFYADAGVVTPSGHTSGGYRLYDIQAIARLELVRTLRDLDAGLDEIRKLLADETTLRDLATAHLALVDEQMSRLRAKRAVLRTIVTQDSATEQVSLMHKLVSMSDDERNRLINQFWTEINTANNFHPALSERLKQRRPKLPEEPTPEQLEAWIELADLLQSDEFRQFVRERKEANSDPERAQRARELSSPAMLDKIEQQRVALLAAREAQEAGMPADSAEAREIAERYQAALGAMTGKDPAESLRKMSDPNSRSAMDPEVVRTYTQFTALVRRYISLVMRINGETPPDPQDSGARHRATVQWIRAALDSETTG